jgi:hypothetical protein
MSQVKTRFQKGDCFRIPWDKDFKDVTFIIYEILPGNNGQQTLYANDINDEETVIGIYDTEVVPI